jgi:hypothetical protein
MTLTINSSLSFMRILIIQFVAVPVHLLHPTSTIVTGY